MSQITVYTTEPCGYCRVAKALLDKRGVVYEEKNLAKDPTFAAKKTELGMFLPKTNHADIGGEEGAGAEDFGDGKKAEKKKLKKAAKNAPADAK